MEKIFDDLIHAVFGTFQPKLDNAQGDPPPLEDEKTIGHGLKILTPQQIITRLPILLAQLKAGNNSQKLKNEIRQIVYSLYRSKNLSRAIYNHLIDTILKWKQYL